MNTNYLADSTSITSASFIPVGGRKSTNFVLPQYLTQSVSLALLERLVKTSHFWRVFPDRI